MTTTHALKYNGAPYTAEGELVHGDDTSITRGPGYAMCACGAVSPEPLANGVQRRAWFKDHKQQAAVEELPSVEAPAVVEEAAPAPEPEPEAPAAEEESFSAVLPFTSASPASFWRYLGRDAVRDLADRGGLGLHIKVATNAANHTVLITGPTEAEVETARERIVRYWDEALTTVKDWKKTDPTFLARPTQGLEGRKAAFELTGAYYMSYVDTFLKELS